MVPKGFRTDIKINPGKIGVEHRQEILDGITDNGTFLPRGVGEEDMDASFVEYAKNDLAITVEGNKVPVVFLTIQRWTEFTKTWTFVDEYKDIQMPFMTVVRRPDIQIGTNQAGLWNIPGNRTYTFMKVPTFDGSRKGIDLYKIPQPTSVDITYEVRIFTGKMKDLNKLNSLIHKLFQSRQAYLNVKGHPMPLVLESVQDESQIEDFQDRRFYVQQFEIRLMGYILDENDFEIIPTINRVYTVLELEENKPLHNVIFDPFLKDNTLVYTIVFKPRASTVFSFNAKYSLTFTELRNVDSITRIIITVNGNVVLDGITLMTPIIINAGDLVGITVFKSFLQTGKFELIGNTI